LGGEWVVVGGLGGGGVVLVLGTGALGVEVGWGLVDVIRRSGEENAEVVGSELAKAEAGCVPEDEAEASAEDDGEEPTATAALVLQA